jgi:hypothetical protein
MDFEIVNGREGENVPKILGSNDGSESLVVIDAVDLRETACYPPCLEVVD